MKSINFNVIFNTWSKTGEAANSSPDRGEIITTLNLRQSGCSEIVKVFIVTIASN